MDISISYSWKDDRLDYTGSDLLEVPAFEFESEYQKNYWYDEWIQFIWIPEFKSYPPFSGDEWNETMTIENVNFLICVILFLQHHNQLSNTKHS